MFQSIVCRSNKNDGPRKRSLRMESLQSRTVMASDIAEFDQPSIDISNEEQMMIELINRARSNPTAEAARYQIDLNQGLTTNQHISGAAQQPLAPVAALQLAATLHAQDLLSRDYFDHVAKDPAPHGKTPSDRAIAAGYGRGVGENLALWPVNGANPQAVIEGSHESLFRSPGHRSNILGEGYNQLGIGVETGDYSGEFFGGKSYETTMTAESFGTGNLHSITGVVLDDKDRDGFYDIGEGLSGVRIVASSSTGQIYGTTSAGSGGFTIQVPDGSYELYASKTGQEERFIGLANVVDKNVKLDIEADQLDRQLKVDTNGDGLISPVDALLIINYLNRDPSGLYPQIFPDNLDVNGNSRIEPVDALIVINELNRRASQALSSTNRQQEGESVEVEFGHEQFMWLEDLANDVIQRKK